MSEGPVGRPSGPVAGRAGSPPVNGDMPATVDDGATRTDAAR